MAHVNVKVPDFTVWFQNLRSSGHLSSSTLGFGGQEKKKKKENLPKSQLFLVTLPAPTINTTGFWQRKLKGLQSAACLSPLLSFNEQLNAFQRPGSTRHEGIMVSKVGNNFVLWSSDTDSTLIVQKEENILKSKHHHHM